MQCFATEKNAKWQPDQINSMEYSLSLISLLYHKAILKDSIATAIQVMRLLLCFVKAVELQFVVIQLMAL